MQGICKNRQFEHTYVCVCMRVYYTHVYVYTHAHTHIYAHILALDSRHNMDAIFLFSYFF